MPSRRDPVASLQALHAAAQQRGGRCLTDDPDQLRGGVELECESGHRWRTSPSLALRLGTWCRFCSRKNPAIPAILQEIAASRGGRLLSPTYEGPKVSLEFACAQGHRWWAAPGSIRNGTWCPICSVEQRARTRRTTTVDHLRALQALAAEKGGRCLSTTCAGPATEIRLVCGAGHRWSKAMREVFRGEWCPRCPPRTQDRLAALAALARARGGSLLSRRYPHGEPRIKLRCAKKHTWEVHVQNLFAGTWCPCCSGFVTTIEDMQELAAMFGGHCLSKRYPGSTKPLRWACGAGHEFRALHKQIRSGQWCRICDWMEGTLGTALGMASRKGGLLVSKPGASRGAPLRWRCAEGHTWLGRVAGIIAGQWCPRCTSTRLTIEDMRRLARDRRGRCLSTVYRNVSTSLLWACERGHQWWARPHAIKYDGRWCSICDHQDAVRARQENGGEDAVVADRADASEPLHRRSPKRARAGALPIVGTTKARSRKRRKSPHDGSLG